MSKYRILAILIGCCLSGSVWASSDDIAQRIKKIGEVCVEGEDCSHGSTAAAVAASSGGASVEDNYNSSCSTCHVAGVAGAPKTGDVVAWEMRIAKGMDTLYGSVINGLPPAMPAKGMCFSCSDDDLKALVDYMVSASQ